MSEDNARITLTKLDVARRQLETAVVLWFAEDDSVSIHTLAAAAHRVVHDLAEYKGAGAFLFDRTRLEQWGYDARAFKKAIREAETFFKHAQNDPQATYRFSARQTECLLCSAIECYHRLSSHRSRLLAVFMTWFSFRHPETLSEFARNKFADLIPAIDRVYWRLKRRRYRPLRKSLRPSRHRTFSPAAHF